MVILEPPFLSDQLSDYLTKNSVPVLENDFSKQLVNKHNMNLNLKTNEEFVDLYNRNNDIYITSELALEWINTNIKNKDLTQQIEVFKNKKTFRDLCKGLDPNFYYAEFNLDELIYIDINSIPLPVVIKPTYGTGSVGVYTIFSEDNWIEAITDIKEKSDYFNSLYSSAVLKCSSFIIESYIKGAEFALDIYFNDTEPVIVTIYEHLFASESDTRDRLYVSNKQLFDKYLPIFKDYFTKANNVLNIKDIIVHVELRVDNGKIAMIEINPLRYAGLCFNDLHYFVAGVHPLHYYFTKTKPDYDAMWNGKEDENYCFCIFDNVDNSSKNNNIESIKAIFSNILSARTIEGEENLLLTIAKTVDKTEFDAILRV